MIGKSANDDSFQCLRKDTSEWNWAIIRNISGDTLFMNWYNVCHTPFAGDVTHRKKLHNSQWMT